MTNFFKIDTYTESSAGKFGLCENAASQQVYVDEVNDQTWLSTATNADEDLRRFIPVKNCLVVDPSCDDPTRPLCNGLFIYSDYLVFVELRNKQDQDYSQWLEDGVVRLKNTIQMYINNHNKDDYQYRTAYLAYRNKRRVATLNSNLKDKFVKETGMQLFVSHEIII